MDQRAPLVIADFLVHLANQAWKGRWVERESVDWLALQVHPDNVGRLDMMETKALKESLALRDKLVNLDYRGPLVLADLLEGADQQEKLANQAWMDGKAEGEGVDWSALQVHPDNVGRLEMMENKALKESLALRDQLVKLDHRGLLVTADFLVQMDLLVHGLAKMVQMERLVLLDGLAKMVQMERLVLLDGLDFLVYQD